MGCRLAGEGKVLFQNFFLFPATLICGQQIKLFFTKQSLEQEAISLFLSHPTSFLFLLLLFIPLLNKFGGVDSNKPGGVNVSRRE